MKPITFVGYNRTRALLRIFNDGGCSISRFAQQMGVSPLRAARIVIRARLVIDRVQQS